MYMQQPPETHPAYDRQRAHSSLAYTSPAPSYTPHPTYPPGGYLPGRASVMTYPPPGHSFPPLSTPSTYGGQGGVRPAGMGGQGVQQKGTFFAAIRNNRPQDVQEMLTEGMGVGVVDRQGNSPLHVACMGGSKRMVKVLLRWGCDVNGQNYQGNTPLHFCFAYHFDPLAAYLITKGADDRRTNFFGLSCYDGLRPERKEDAARAVHEHAAELPPGLTEAMVLAADRVD